MSDHVKSSISKLNNHNYQVWKYKMELLLIKKELWSVVNDERLADPSDDWITKDGKARATIGLLIEDGQLVHVRKETSARGSWEALRKYHQKSTLSNKVSLLKKLCALKLEEGGDMEEHLNAIGDLLDRLTCLGEEIASPLTVALILSSLPESFATLITALETRPEEDLTPDLVKGKLLEEYTRRKETNATGISEKALKFVAEKRVHHKEVKAIDHYDKRKETKGTCYFCKKPGHFKKDCRKFALWKGNNPPHKANQVSDHNESEYCFTANDNFIGNKWYIDSGATAHMTSDKHFFTKFDPDVKDKIVLANGNVISSEGIGNGVLKCLTGTNVSREIPVKNVLYVPELDGNLLSVRKLTDNDLTVQFQKDGCHILHKGKEVATATIGNSLYELNEEPHNLKMIHACKSECIHTWHRRLGHRDPRAIKDLLTKELATGIEISDCHTQLTCECCIKGKMSKLPFPKKSDSKSSGILDLVHTDVCGPMRTMTPGKKRYLLTVIDDYSRFTVIYLLNRKSEVPSKLKEYVQYVKNRFGKSIKKIRSDRGGEYTGNDFQNFLKEEGIQSETTAPYTPEQNGCAERKNRSLVEMARCMLIDANLPDCFWGEAITTANHLQNRLPTKATDATPYEKWSGKKPNLDYIRIFGTKAYVKIPDEQRHKLEGKATEMVFVGYETGSKAYRLLNPDTKTIKISREVRFLEDTIHKAIGEVSSDEKENLLEKQESSEILNIEKNDVVKIPENQQDDEPSDIDEENDDEQGEQILIPFQQPALPRRSERRNKGEPPKRLIETMKVVAVGKDEPRTLKDALASLNAPHWREAMDEEMSSLQECGTWEIVKLPPGKSTVGSKWVYKLKYDDNGHVDRFKARLVAQGFSQVYGQDYDEIFAPVVKPTTLRTLLSIAGQKNMTVKHFDIQTAFLNAELEHEVYMRQPEGYATGENDSVCKLKKNIYGLKQGAREWNKKLNSALIEDGFQKSKNDPCLYFKETDGVWIYVLTYVDDIITASVSEKLIEQFEKKLASQFQVKNLGNLKYYLGIQFERDSKGYFSLHQGSYIEKKLKEFKLQDSRPSNIPMDPGYQKRNEVQEPIQSNVEYRSAIGSLLYLATNSRPDIAVSTSIVARKVTNPMQSDWTEVKRIFRYLKGTSEKRLCLGSDRVLDSNQLVGYADADWGGDVEDRKSNTGYFFMWNGGTISWSSRKQDSVALSTTEAEYMALAEASQDAIWIERLLRDFNERPNNKTVIYEDNQSCIKMLEMEKINRRTKHIETKYHFVRDLHSSGQLQVRYCPSAEMTADLLTKPLEAVKTRKFVFNIGLI